MPTDERETPTADEQPAPALQPGELIVLFWIAAYVGTIAAGGAFGVLLPWLESPGVSLSDIDLVGLLAGLFICFMFGAVIASMFAIPIHLTIAILTWAFWLKRFRLVTAAVAGTVTGVAATIDMSPLVDPGFAIIAGILGGIGSAAAGFLHIKRQANKRPTAVASGKTVWQFTIRDLLVRMTVLAMLVSAWTYYFKAVRKDREREQQQYQQAYEAAQQPADDRLHDETAPVAAPTIGLR